MITYLQIWPEFFKRQKGKKIDDNTRKLNGGSEQ